MAESRQRQQADEEVSAPAPIDVLKALAREGLTFSDCVKVFAEQDHDQDTDAYVSAAEDRYAEEGSIEVDAPTVVSVSDDGGAYVMAWLWVSNGDAGIADTCERCGNEPVTDEDSGLGDKCRANNDSRVVL